MNIVADENIPFAKMLFSLLGDVRLVHGRNCSKQDVEHAQALITRSVTKVDAALLNNSKVRFVGTCTIGTDHIDQGYLRRNDIEFHSAPGCNANSVVQYVVCALNRCGKLRKGLRVAIIGCGNVGSRVYRTLTALGMDCVGIDPFLIDGSELGDGAVLRLEQMECIADADIVCMHTPLTSGGDYPTRDLIDAQRLAQMKPGALLLNAGRGECVNQKALLSHLEQGNDLSVVLDVWNGEPGISTALFERVTIGTPHIAGYSFEGKVNGSTMIFSHLAPFLGKSDTWIKESVSGFRAECFGKPQAIHVDSIGDALTQSYDIDRDYLALKRVLAGLPYSFDLLRKKYPGRREFSHYRISNRRSTMDTQHVAMLGMLGFLK